MMKRLKDSFCLNIDFSGFVRCGSCIVTCHCLNTTTISYQLFSSSSYLIELNFIIILLYSLVILRQREINNNLAWLATKLIIHLNLAMPCNLFSQKKERYRERERREQQYKWARIKTQSLCIGTFRHEVEKSDIAHLNGIRRVLCSFVLASQSLGYF